MDNIVSISFADPSRMRGRTKTLGRSHTFIGTRHPVVVSSRRPGRTQHAPPLATWSEGSTPYYPDRGGQLPRDHGTGSHRQGTEGVPNIVDHC